MARGGAASWAAHRRSLAAQRCGTARPATCRSSARAARCEGVAMEGDIRVITGRGSRRLAGSAPRGARLAGLWPVETFFFLNNQAWVRSTFALPSGARGRAATWGQGPPPAPDVASPVATARAVVGHEVAARGAAKLRKIKHLQRKRGATHYRGQSAGWDVAKQGRRADAGAAPGGARRARSSPRRRR